MSWENTAQTLAMVISYLNDQTPPGCDVVIVLRNDKTDDQLVGGSRDSTPDTIAFLQRAIRRLKTEPGYEAHQVVDKRTKRIVKKGKA